MIRHDWTIAELQEIYEQPFLDLIYQAQTVHRAHHPRNKVQRSTLLSIKTGGCPENCAYCPQSAHYDTGVTRHGVLPKDFVIEKAKAAQAAGSTRFCMGAAWRAVKDNEEFDKVIELVEAVSGLGMEVCCTLGMLTAEQGRRLREAGCFAYNHNLDTSPEYYKKIISTRTYEDRLDTLGAIRESGMTVCCGGILGMGESQMDRLGLLVQLTRQNPHPESVPINMLQPIEGTPLEKQMPVDPIEFVRMIATARIALPESMVRLSAGRVQMSDETQALCFVAGANSIHAGDKLLTAENATPDHDVQLFEKLGLEFMDITDTQSACRAHGCDGHQPVATASCCAEAKARQPA